VDDLGAKVMMRTSDGYSVIDRPNSHNHLPLAILKEAVGKVTMAGAAFQKTVVDMGRIVGKTECVETTDDDEIVYSTRPGRKGPTRFVLNREPEDTQFINVILKRADEGYVLISAFFGGNAEPEPWDRHATQAAVDFWATHALIVR